MSPDLDIFGSEEETSEADRAADENSMDIFGEDAEEAKAEAEAEGESEESGEEKSETAEGEDGELDWTSIFGEDSSEGETADKENKEDEGKDSELDPEIESLLTEASGADDVDERDSIIDELRQKLVDQQVEIDALTRHKQVLNDKLMASSASDTELGMYKETISQLESNPKLRALVRYVVKTDDTSKNRAIGILADMLEDLTGQDISSTLEKSRNDKAKAALGGTPSAAPSGKSEEEEGPMDYEESISSLF